MSSSARQLDHAGCEWSAAIVQLAVFREAEAAYEANTGEKLAHWQRRLLARYTRNLALTAGQLCAGLFDLDGGGALGGR